MTRSAESKEYCEGASVVSLHLVDAAYHASFDQWEQANEELDEANRVADQISSEFQAVRDVRNELDP